jgi:hypothetical protein
MRDRADAQSILEQGEIGVMLTEESRHDTVVLERNAQPPFRSLRLAALGGAYVGWIAKSCQYALPHCSLLAAAAGLSPEL